MPEMPPDTAMHVVSLLGRRYLPPQRGMPVLSGTQSCPNRPGRRRHRHVGAPAVHLGSGRSHGRYSLFHVAVTSPPVHCSCPAVYEQIEAARHHGRSNTARKKLCLACSHSCVTLDNIHPTGPRLVIAASLTTFTPSRPCRGLCCFVRQPSGPVASSARGTSCLGVHLAWLGSPSVQELAMSPTLPICRRRVSVSSGTASCACQTVLARSLW